MSRVAVPINLRAIHKQLNIICRPRNPIRIAANPVMIQRTVAYA
jgi:hypothetical protein